MSDTFRADTERIGKLMNQFKSDLTKREQKRSEGKMTGIIDAELRGSLTQLDNELDNLQKLINDFQDDPRKYNLLAREVERRRNAQVQFVNQRNELKKRLENHSVNQQQKQLFNKPSENNQTFQQQYSEQDNKGLFQVQKQLVTSQDDQLDQINMKVTSIKYIGLGINDSIKQQNKYINQLSDDIDKTTSAMTKTKNKMTKFVKESSQCGLMITIILELVGLVMILVLL